MPYRLSLLFPLGVLGLVAVGVLALLGADLRRHARSGGRLKQRLVSAGLGLLGLLGFAAASGTSGCNKNQPGSPNPPGPGPTGPSAGGGSHGGGGGEEDPPAHGVHPVPDKAKISEDRIAEVTAEAREVASSKRGQYPFDEKGKEALLSALKDAEEEVDAVARAGRINDAEAGLWKADLRQLAGKVAEFRPTEMQLATCYEPMALPIPAQNSLRRLKLRLPLLAKLAAADKINLEVTRRVLEQVEADHEVLSSDTRVAALRSEEERAEARRLAVEVGEALKRIRARLALPPRGKAALESTPQWQLVHAAWTAIAPHAANSPKSTSAQRQEADARMKEALAAVDVLVKEGLLVPAEAGLLKEEAEGLKKAMYRSPPADMAVRCYRQAFLPPARESLARLDKRLPLLARLSAAGKIRPEVLEKVLPAVDRDLAVLADPRELKQLDAGKRAEAARTAARVQELLTRLKGGTLK